MGQQIQGHGLKNDVESGSKFRVMGLKIALNGVTNSWSWVKKNGVEQDNKFRVMGLKIVMNGVEWGNKFRQ